jgi:hypothetical protein
MIVAGLAGDIACARPGQAERKNALTAAAQSHASRELICSSIFTVSGASRTRCPVNFVHPDVIRGELGDRFALGTIVVTSWPEACREDDNGKPVVLYQGPDFAGSILAGLFGS